MWHKLVWPSHNRARRAWEIKEFAMHGAAFLRSCFPSEASSQPGQLLSSARPGYLPGHIGNSSFFGRKRKRCLTALAGAACFGLLITTGAFAQVQPNPDNPNDTVADAMTPPPYGEPINLETAKKVAAAALAETSKRNWNALCISIVNPSGDLVYFEKQDNCQYASIGISQHKARTAARYRRPTLAFENLMGKGPYFAYLATLDDVIASRGGNLLTVDGKVVGAIGVSGGSGAQDNVVSLAGQAELK